ncbi:MAG: hypothetical protein ACI9BF_000253 [Candidatus Paceibacteria bacterium]|jgi:hypothetical protein
MPKEPQIESLSYKHRTQFFWLLVLVFLVALPALIFYTTGYRLSFENEETSIVTTGGIYITTDNLEVDVYLDDEQVERPRLFRSAYYIQNIEVGQHRVVVQRPDLITWVKDMPVDPYIVTEASAFNMPVVPHVRPITKYATATGTQVYLGVPTSTQLFSGVTTTVPVLITPSKIITEYDLNEEYIFVKSLFSSTSTSTRSVFERILDEVERFRFSTTSDALVLDSSTTTEPAVERGGIRLTEREGELYAVWQDAVSSIPYYFCVADTETPTTTYRYGEHVALEINRMKVSTTSPIIVDGNRICRSEIRLDRQRMDVFFYDFYPGSSDLVLLQLEDGLYVTEIDDRSWQNSQLIYQGTDLHVIVENGVIYILDDNHYFEIITEIEPI